MGKGCSGVKILWSRFRAHGGGSSRSALQKTTGYALFELPKNLDFLLRAETALPIKIATGPLSAVAVGAGMAQSNLEMLRDLEK
jgi:actin-like ATPase involved in cell morphogenesis